jgi:hypothetical protein
VPAGRAMSTANRMRPAWHIGLLWPCPGAGAGVGTAGSGALVTRARVMGMLQAARMPSIHPSIHAVLMRLGMHACTREYELHAVTCLMPWSPFPTRTERGYQLAAAVAVNERPRARTPKSGQGRAGQGGAVADIDHP